MQIAFCSLTPHRNRYMPFLEKLEALYHKMDNQYNQTATRYGFTCRGCEDNCCMSRFYHHTLLEYLHIMEGVEKLAGEIKEKALARAERVNDKLDAADLRGETIRLMCPLNIKGLCSLYGCRPMICRLHGIPHALYHPQKGTLKGPGCHEFQTRCSNQDHIRLDRTPFYIQVAQLEKELRAAMHFPDKIRLTVSQMLVTGI